MLKIIISNRNTELVAKRRGIEESMRYFEDNPKKFFTEIRASWKRDSDLKKIKQNIILRREIVSQFLGSECLQYWKNKNGTLYLHKMEYLDLWELLVDNQKEIRQKLVSDEKRE